MARQNRWMRLLAAGARSGRPPRSAGRCRNSGGELEPVGGAVEPASSTWVEFVEEIRWYGRWTIINVWENPKQ
jgi:hypothetical protein